MMRASAAQRGLWSAQSVTPPSSVFTVGQLLDFDDRPDVDRLLAAARSAVAEADGLRSVFRPLPDGDVAVDAGAQIPVTHVDLGAESAAIDQHAAQAVSVAIDPTVGPCARVTVLTAGDRTSLLVIAHHIVLDAYGLGLLDRRIGALYADPTDDRRLRSVTDLPADHDAPRGTDHEFWDDEVAGVSGPLTLSDRPRSHRIAAAVHTARVTVAGAGNSTATPARVVSAIAAFCGRYADTRDVVLGFPMMNRLGSPAANVPCTTVNVLPLRIAVAPGDCLDDITERAGARLRTIAPHSRHRGEEIVRAARRHGVDGVVGPTINVKPFGTTIGFGEVSAHITSLARGPVVDLSITALGLPDGDLELLLDGDADLYPHTRLEEIAEHLRSFVATALAHSDQPVGGIGIDPELLETVEAIRAADARTRVRADTCSVAERLTARRDASIAIVTGDGTLDYAELNRQADRLADELTGCGAEDIVAVRLPRGADLVVALLAVLRRGAAFLPLDPGFPTDRIEATLADARPVAMIEPGDDGPHVLSLRAGSGHPTRAPRADTPAYVIYTSGSTGKPKGVVVSHRALTNFADAMIDQLEFRAEQKILAVTTISFDISILEVLVPLAAGMSVVIASTDDVHDPARLAALITTHDIDHVQATPSLWSAFLDAGHADALGSVSVLVGGEQLPTEVASGLAGAARSTRNMYGPTETTIWSTTSVVQQNEPVTIGTPIDNTGVRILDTTLHPVPDGRVGELYLSGDGLARGYHARGALTSERFVADPFGAPGARMYRTGDLARTRADDSLECLGRIDHQVKVRGFRIELGDIESTLAEHHSVDRAVAATSGGRLVAYVIPAPGGVNDAELRAHLISRLPDYMLPTAILPIDQFPLTPNGKIDRRALPAPDFAAIAERTRAPETQAEHAFADIFASVLDVPRVGAEADFFLLGGDSIRAVRVVTAAARAGFEITALDVFDRPTVAALAKVARTVDSASEQRDNSFGTSDDTATTTAGVGADELDDLMDGNLL
ncbi:amino acid adenylation domain-containing protein [Gordonia sp. PKS22-38]|uniref:Amino acid adenylation domain-containing protein n=1 Tax=Gordonia prachuapensis TaxID=3115651 RepID=A0ABU7MRV5_9ACTN|nr:amino acid adenylation domain-containing protein [Gordonia sp. PKS22-38]